MEQLDSLSCIVHLQRRALSICYLYSATETGFDLIYHHLVTI